MHPDQLRTLLLYVIIGLKQVFLTLLVLFCEPLLHSGDVLTRERAKHMLLLVIAGVTQADRVPRKTFNKITDTIND